MSNRENQKSNLGYLLGSIQIIKEWLEDETEETLVFNLKTRDAIMYRLYCIGKVSDMISDDIKTKYKTVPWSTHSALRIPEIYSEDNIFDIVMGFEHNGEKEKGLVDYFDDIENIYIYQSILTRQKNLAPRIPL